MHILSTLLYSHDLCLHGICRLPQHNPFQQGAWARNAGYQERLRESARNLNKVEVFRSNRMSMDKEGQ